MMNQEIKTAWIAALRSGQYEQTTKRLRTPDGYCCLGVLCDLATQEGIVAWKKQELDEYDAFRAEEVNEETSYSTLALPPVVVDWAGLTDGEPRVLFSEENNTRPEALSCLNDEDRLTYEEIADLIEGDDTL